MHTQKNLDRFYSLLESHYSTLFLVDADYSYIKAKSTPAQLARIMVLGLDNGTADKGGKAVISVCKDLGIPHTYKAIRAFLGAE